MFSRWVVTCSDRCTKLLSSTDVSCGALLKLLVKFPITGEVDPKLILQGIQCTA